MIDFHASIAAVLLAGGVFTLVGPVVLGAVIRRCTGARIVWFLLGAATFFVSQCILRLPWQIPLAMWVGKRLAGHPGWTISWMAASALTAALFEECGRYLTMRWLCKAERSWRVGVMMGAGHGGVESMLLIAPSLLVGGALYVMAGTGHLPTLPPEATATLLEGFAKLTWWDASAGALERVPAIASHVAMSALVAEGFVRGRPARWLGFAISAHFVLDCVLAGGAILLAKKTGSPLVGELALLPALVLSILAIRALRPRP